MIKYAVDIFDGTSGESAEFSNLEDAKKDFCKKKNTEKPMGCTMN